MVVVFKVIKSILFEFVEYWISIEDNAIKC